MNYYNLAKNFAMAANTMENNLKDIRAFKQQSHLTPTNYSKQKVYQALYAKLFQSAKEVAKYSKQIEGSHLIHYIMGK